MIVYSGLECLSSDKVKESCEFVKHCCEIKVVGSKKLVGIES